MTDKLGKVTQLLRLMDSPIEEEAVAAVRAMRRLDVDFNDIAERIEKPPAPEKPLPPSDAEIAQIYEVAESEAYKRFKRAHDDFRRRCGLRPDGSYDLEAMAVFVQHRKSKIDEYWRDVIDRWAAQLTAGRFPLTDPQKKRLLALFRQAGGLME